tara:strand:- start:122 stop:244 length:123 start_codon:yes stop_codon:yes gene_type:complete
MIRTNKELDKFLRRRKAFEGLSKSSREKEKNNEGIIENEK